MIRISSPVCQSCSHSTARNAWGMCPCGCRSHQSPTDFAPAPSRTSPGWRDGFGRVRSLLARSRISPGSPSVAPRRGRADTLVAAAVVAGFCLAYLWVALSW